MKPLSPFSPRDRTAYIQVDPSRCVACGRCGEACPRRVLGLVRFFSHRHVHLDRPQDCKGCLNCVKTCEHDAIRPGPPVMPRNRHRDATGPSR